MLECRITALADGESTELLVILAGRNRVEGRHGSLAKVEGDKVFLAVVVENSIDIIVGYRTADLDFGDACAEGFCERLLYCIGVNVSVLVGTDGRGLCGGDGGAVSTDYRDCN